MTRAISTSAKPISYYCALPPHIENLFGSHFEELEHSELFGMLATLTRYADYAVASSKPSPEGYNPEGYSLFDAYMDCHNPVRLGDNTEIVLNEIEGLQDLTLLHLCEALIAHLLYTTEIQR